MRKILVISVSLIIAAIVIEMIYVTASQASPATCDQNSPKSDAKKLWIDTIMFAMGHSFGYSGDVSDWDGWYYDTVRVGDDPILKTDSVGPSTLRLDLVTRYTIVDLGSKDAAGEIKKFLSPIDGFKRFGKKYSVALDSVYDDDHGWKKCCGRISFVADYADKSKANAEKINRFMVDLVCYSSDAEIKVPALTSLFLGDKRSRQSGKKSDGAVKDMEILSNLIKNTTIDYWRKDEDLPYEGSASRDLAVRINIVNSSFATFSVYDYERVGSGHGGYIETFHTFDINNEKELSNKDIFKPKTLDKVKLLLYDVMANNPRYIAWNSRIKSASDVKERFEGTNLNGQEDSKFTLPQGALTNTGVVFSFQPYEIGCWAEGVYHFVIPYKSLMPYLTSKTKALLKEVGL